MITINLSEENYNDEIIRDINQSIIHILGRSGKNGLRRQTDRICIYANDKNGNKSLVSCAIVSAPEDITKANDYLKKHRAKQEYRNITETEQIKQIISDAIKNNRVTIFFQPIYSIQKKKFISAEILARILDADGNIIPPAKFIPVAEKSGQIHELEGIILEKTCGFIQTYPLDMLGLEYLEMNLSVKTGESPGIADKYLDSMKKHNIDPSLLNLEITETATASQKQKLVSNMHALIKRGVSFSLDDFGSGESNLNYVIDMPVSIIKFDMNMTRAYLKNEKAEIVMSSAVKMAHELGFKTVAEGVESIEAFSKMEEIGIDYIQGYLFSRPVPEDEFVRFIQEHNQTGKQQEKK